MPGLGFFTQLPTLWRRLQRASLLASLLPLAFYLLVTRLMFDTSPDWSNHYFGEGDDPVTLTWFLNWWGFALAHGLNFFVSKYAWFPSGTNLTWDTAVPALALLAAPIIYLKGALFAFNFLSITAPALAAWTAFLLARQISNHWPASVIGGYLFGFSAYELGQLREHLNLDSIFLIPLAVLLCVRRLQGNISQPVFIILLAAIFVIQLGISTELLATLGFFGAVAWLIFLLFGRHELRPRLFGLARDLVLTCIVALICASPFLFYLYAALPVPARDLDAAFVYSVDPLNIVIPTTITQLGGMQFAAISAHYLGGIAEQGAYVGLPMLLLVTLYLHAQRARPMTRALAICLIFCLVLSLGPRLRIFDGPALITLPWSWFRNLPLLGSALPSRFSLYVSLCCAIISTLYLACPGSNWQHFRRYALVGVVIAFMLPNRTAYGWSTWPTEAFFTTGNIEKTLGHSPNVLILPYGSSGPGMAWQMDAGMSFTQSGGYTGLDPSSEKGIGIWEQLRDGTVSSHFSNDLKALCATHQVDDLLIGPGTPPILVTAIGALNWPEVQDRGVTVVTVPARADLSYYQISGDYWPSEAPANWMGHQILIKTRHTPITLILTKDTNQPDPTILSVAGTPGPTSYRVVHGQPLSIAIPANADITLTANQTFIPDKTLHNRDDRSLSVILSIRSP
ncbi:MAG: hypothetical protein B7Z75_03285 [Acidocella sp. 20-57-95]|nr:MAG: hypothetical protein B7Z75_03285 [Acidocella sp. 20-57-95]OYV60478.1 MAG: hypothetical protein B7Z71_06190 [Acidocella sp. 21-58-7]HQU04726.1 hypothetical protein [Acidocella sp.]